MGRCVDSMATAGKTCDEMKRGWMFNRVAPARRTDERDVNGDGMPIDFTNRPGQGQPTTVVTEKITQQAPAILQECVTTPQRTIPQQQLCISRGSVQNRLDT